MSITQRLKSVTKIPPEYLTTTPPPPKSIKLELTSRCNYKCKYCPVSMDSHNRRGTMDKELSAKILDDVKKNSVNEVGLFYIGEPFFDFSFVLQALIYAKGIAKVPYVFLTSNASLAIGELTKLLMEAGLDSLKWSCNYADEKQFEEMTGVNSAFLKKALVNIKGTYALREAYGYKTRLYASSIMYTPEQKDKMQPILNEFIRPYVDEHYWLPLYSAGGKASDIEKRLGLKPIAGNIGPLDDPTKPIPCWTLFTSCHVMWDGTVTACCLDGTGYWKVGDLKTQTLMEAWHSPDFIELRKRHLNNDIEFTKCANCAFYQA